MPIVKHELLKLSVARYFATFDLSHGYWEIEPDAETRHLQSFVTPDGLFQGMMDKVSVRFPFARVYLDDVSVFSGSMDEHIDHILQVLKVMESHKPRFKISQCLFAKLKLKLLPHCINARGISVDPIKFDFIRKASQPRDNTGLRSFLGLASYYRQFTPGLSDISSVPNAAI